MDRLMGEHGLAQDTAAARRQFERQMEMRRLEEVDPDALRILRRGWCLGSRDFKSRMLETIEGKLGDHHSGELRRETAEAKTERIVGEELRRLGWKETDLVARRKSDPAKLALAARLRKETTLSIKAIATRAHLGSSKSANARLHQWMAQGASADAQGRLRL